MARTLEELDVLVRQLQGLAVGEDWHYIGATGEPGFNNSWVNTGGGAEPARFFKDSFGMVHVQGRIKNGTNNTGAWTMPSGYLPDYNSYHLTLIQGGTNGYVYVDTLGQVVINGANNNDTAFSFAYRVAP